MMNNVLALAELSTELEEQGFLGVIEPSGNSNDSNGCGSGRSSGC